MDLNLGLGIAGFVIGIIGLGFALYTYRKGKKEKKLVYEILPPIPIAEVFPKSEGYELSIVFEIAGTETSKLNSVMVHFIRFSNFGDDPILRSDIAPDDQLRIEFNKSDILDVSLVSTTRNVSGITLGNIINQQDTNFVQLLFDFLDKGDGGLIQVVTSYKDLDIDLKGTIVGMPGGPIKTDEIGKATGISGWGCVPIIALQLASLALVAFLYNRTIGSWDNVYFLLLPLAAVAVPGLIALLIISLIDQKQKFKFSDLLSPPRWYHQRLYFYDRFPTRNNKGYFIFIFKIDLHNQRST